MVSIKIEDAQRVASEMSKKPNTVQMTPWLTAGEVEELTGLVRWQAQSRALARMRVPFRPNAQGRPLVERSVVLTHRERERTITVPKWEAA